MGLLDGKSILVTGILTDASLAFHIAQRAQLEGATVIVSGFGRGLSLTKRVIRKLPVEPALIEIDVTDELQLGAAAEAVAALVCAAVAPKAAAGRYRSATVTVVINGRAVPVSGSFVKVQGSYR